MQHNQSKTSEKSNILYPMPEEKWIGLDLVLDISQTESQEISSKEEMSTSDGCK